MKNSNQNDTVNNKNTINNMNTESTHMFEYTDTSTISVFEHQRLTAHDFVQASDFTWLLAQEFAVFTIKRQRGQWQLKVGHYIGIILLPSGMTLEILPKPVGAEQTGQLRQLYEKPHKRQHSDVVQTRQWVQRMLSDLTNTNNKLPNSKNLGQMSNDLTPLPIQVPPLSQWLVTQFLQLLSRYQPTKHYQAQVRNQAALQGKLLVKEQLRRNSTQPHKFVCETSVLSQDMLSNRLIKSALLLVEKLTIARSSDTSNNYPDSNNQKRQSEHGSHYNNNKQTTSFSIALSPWRQIAALNHYELRLLDSLYTQAKRQLNIQPLRQQQLKFAQQLLDLAYWLLKQSGAETGSGISAQALPMKAIAQPRLCLLINMNQAFEQWASQRIAAMFSHANPNYQPLYQPQRVWLSDNAGQACLSIRPDLLIYRPADHHAIADNQVDNRRIYSRIYSHVIDIKWKHLSHSGAISASDAYQLTSYAQAYQAQQVWLVYPVIDDTRQPVALSQQAYGNGGAVGGDSESDDSNYAKLWVMPFNVLTGTLNGEIPQDLSSE